MKNDHRSKFTNWKEEAWKWVSTGFEPVTSVIPVRCSTNWAYEATHWERGQFILFIESYLLVRSKMMWSMYKIIHIWTVAVEENLLQWSFFTFIYNCSSNMSYFIYTSQSCNLINCDKQISFSVKHEFRKLFFMTHEQKVLHEPWRAWIIHHYLWFYCSFLHDFET